MNVTACLVTRGDQPEMMESILDSLIFENVVIWDNSQREDWKCAGRYMAALEAQTQVVYFQDDDVLVPPETQRRLVEAYMPGVCIANWGHGDDHDGYDDLPLVGAGAVMDVMLPWQSIARYARHHSLDEDFAYYCDFAIGVLYRDFRHLYLPFHIELSVAQHPSRLCNQSWAYDLKLELTNRARVIRDRELVPA